MADDAFDAPNRHRAALAKLADELREQLDGLTATLDRAAELADVGIGEPHAAEGRALVSLVCAADRVVAALAAGQPAERLVEATIRGGYAAEAVRGRLAELTPLADLAREELDRRSLAADFGDPVVTGAQLQVSGTPSTVGLTVDRHCMVHWTGTHYRMRPVDGQPSSR